ncbi:MAG: hypothetical protein SF162_01285 [bacterium]|nr:hypothetical protein [bacterium]
MPTTKKKPAVPSILPREPLTSKARAAIHKYAALKGEKKMYLMYFMVDLVLEAERMRRSALYAWLEDHGYRWNSGIGWKKKDVP